MDVRKQASGQWIPLHTKGINHSLTVKGCQKASWWSVDRIAGERNESFTFCHGDRMQENHFVVRSELGVT
jgi:hypothetical protein